MITNASTVCILLCICLLLLDQTMTVKIIWSDYCTKCQEFY